MRLAAESLRAQWRREGLLRGVALAALGVAALVALWRARTGDAATDLVVHRQFDATPSALERDSLGALARAGRRVTWSGELAPLVAMAEPLREPGRRWRIAAVGTAPLLLQDSLGLVDSLEAAAAITLEPTRGAAQLVQSVSRAEVAATATAEPRGVAVLGRVGWEPRFIITALEEAGWRVDARLALGRERDVRQGDAMPRLDRHDVVIVTDSATARANVTSLLQFVRGGGGLILAGEAAATQAPALRAIVAATVRGLEDPETRSFEGHEPTHALPLYALAALRRDANVLEDREGTPSIAARRLEAGRVMQVGYAETWRWRMEGEGRSVEEHRAYWSRLAGLVARGVPRPVPAIADAKSAAPQASLVQAVGPAVTAPPARGGEGPPFPLWLGPIILLALLAEWGSRRRRGVP